MTSDTYLLPFVLLLIILIIIFLKKNYICVATHVYISNDLWFPGNVHTFNMWYTIENENCKNHNFFLFFFFSLFSVDG